MEALNNVTHSYGEPVMFPAMWRHESYIEQLQHITALLTSDFNLCRIFLLCTLLFPICSQNHKARYALAKHYPVLEFPAAAVETERQL